MDIKISDDALMEIVNLLLLEIQRYINNPFEEVVESDKFQELLSKVKEYTRGQEQLASLLQQMITQLNEINSRLDKSVHSLSRAVDIIVKRIERETIIGPEYFTKILDIDMTHFTQKHYQVLLAVLELEKEGLRPHLTNISEKTGLRRDEKFQKILEFLTGQGLLRVVEETSEGHIGRIPKGIYRLTEKARMLLRPPESSEHSILLRKALIAFQKKGLLALALPEIPGKSLPDGIVVQPTKDEKWNWEKIIAVEVESVKEIRYQYKHIVSMIFRRIREGYQEIHLFFREGYEDIFNRFLNKGVRELFEDRYQRALQIFWKKTKIYPIPLHEFS